MGIRNKAPEAQPIMVALFGGAYRVKGTRYTVAADARLRADHPLVKYRPTLFAPDGSTAAEMHAARTAYSNSKGAVRQEPRRPSPYAGWKAQDPLVRVDPR